MSSDEEPQSLDLAEEERERTKEKEKEPKIDLSTKLLDQNEIDIVSRYQYKSKDFFFRILDPILSSDNDEESKIESLPPLHNHDQNKYIFQERPMEDLFDRVSNLLKHYLRQFVNNYSQYEHLYSEEENKSNLKQVSRLRRRLQEKEGITKKEIGQILRKEKRRELSRKNRRVMREILGKDVCENSKKENRLFHMITCRVFAIRCMSEELIKRNVSH